MTLSTAQIQTDTWVNATWDEFADSSWMIRNMRKDAATLIMAI
jgi:hypothetical protein